MSLCFKSVQIPSCFRQILQRTHWKTLWTSWNS